MNPRTTAVLFLLAAALGAFVWFYEIEGQEGRQAAEESKDRLFPGLNSDQVEWVELTTTDGQSVRIERREGAWQLAKPIEYRADAFVVDGIVGSLTQMTSESAFASPQAPETYGLGAGARELAFGAGGTEHRVRIGAQTPVGGNDYVSVAGRPEVFVVRSYRVSAFGKRLDELRDKRIVEASPDAVESIAVRWKDGHVALAREGGAWRLREPLEGPADEATVQALLSSLSLLRASSFADAPLPDAETGLDHPELVVELGLAPAAEGGEKRSTTLAMGKLLASGDRAVRAGGGTLFLVSGSRIDDVPRSVVAYRFKELAKFPADSARRVELAFAAPEGAPVAITAKRDEDGTWSSEPEAMDPEKIGALVDELSQLRARGILADSMGADELRGLGLDPPRAKLVVQGEGGKPLAEVHLGTAREGGAILAQSASNTSVFELDPAVGEILPVSLEAFRGLFLARPPAEAPVPGASALEPAPGPEAPAPEAPGTPAAPPEPE